MAKRPKREEIEEKIKGIETELLNLSKKTTGHLKRIQSGNPVRNRLCSGIH